MIEECKVCTLHRRISDAAGSYPGLLYVDEHWIVRHSEETNILGYFIIDSRRHFLDLSQGTKAEIDSYGQVVAMVMRAIRSVRSCSRIYTFSLAEAVPHFHLHVIPRHPDFPRAYAGRGIMSYPLSPAANPELVKEVVARARAALRRSHHPSV